MWNADQRERDDVCIQIHSRLLCRGIVGRSGGWAHGHYGVFPNYETRKAHLIPDVNKTREIKNSMFHV